MEYDEIDDYVNQLFRDQGEQPADGEVLSGDWRIDRIDEIIQDTYDEAIWWHNEGIRNKGNPEHNPSGLRGVKDYIPWDERIDGVAAMQGAIGGLSEGSYERNGGDWRQHSSQGQAHEKSEQRGLGCGETVVICLVVFGLFLWMAFIFK